jgi:hypothetical protein
MPKKPIKPILEQINPLIPVLENPPEDLKKLISLLADSNLTFNQIDQEMGFPLGETRKKLERWPILKQAGLEARALALRTAGIDKAKVYKVYSEAMDANTITPEGIMEDHKTRIMGADRAAVLLGEKISSTGNVNVQVNNNVALTPDDVDRLEAILNKRRAERNKVIDV